MKKTLLISALLAAALPALAQESVSLNGEWTFRTPDTEPVTVTVPHTYNIMDGLEEYAGKAFYSRTLPLTSEMAGQRVRVHFNAVYHDAIVYVNGQKAGEHLDAGYSPFSFDITPFVDFSKENEILVECSNHYSETAFPYSSRFDWANDGGIIRDVALRLTGPLSLRYVHITPDIDLSDSTAVANVEVKLWEKAPKKADISLKITENRTGRVVYDALQTLKLTPEGTYSFNVDCGKVQLWHFDDPALYTYEAAVMNKKAVSDTRSERFGFRKIEIVGEHLVLNGENVRLPGIENMPGSNPSYGMAESHEYMEKTIGRMKDLNCTVTRFHWPQDDYRMCVFDEVGILVQEELPWWQGPETKLTPEQVESAKRQLGEFIEAHYNHPSIFAWGISNEVRDNRADLPELYAYAKSLDSSRFVDVVCNNIYADLENDPSLMLDLPTWNEYMGTWHGKSREDFVTAMPEVKKVLNGRPIMITEHGLCEPAYAGGDSRRVDEMIWHISHWRAEPSICGYIYFSLEDYRTHIGEEGIGRDKVRRHGVCDKYLEPKASYYVLQQLMSPIAITKVSRPGRVRPGSPAPANPNAASIVLKAFDDCPSYTVRGYKLVYESIDGQSKSIDLPDLAPGQEHSLVIDDLNRSFKFDIVRPNGGTVIRY